MQSNIHTVKPIFTVEKNTKKKSGQMRYLITFLILLDLFEMLSVDVI
jgi:hypothetical protein